MDDLISHLVQYPDHWTLVLKKTGFLMVCSLGMGLPPKCRTYVEEEAGMLQGDAKEASAEPLEKRGIAVDKQ